jgi:hypothetical protein
MNKIQQGLKLQGNARNAFEMWAEAPSPELKAHLLMSLAELEHQIAAGYAELPRKLATPAHLVDRGSYRAMNGLPVSARGGDAR